MMLSQSTKAKVRSLHGDTDSFSIVAVVLEGDAFVIQLKMVINHIDHLFYY